MAQKSKSRPHRSKPYDQKMAERAAAKRAMRTGGGGKENWERPDARPAQNARIDQPSEPMSDMGGEASE